MLGEYSIAAGKVNQEDGQTPFFGQTGMKELENRSAGVYV